MSVCSLPLLFETWGFTRKFTFFLLSFLPRSCPYFSLRLFSFPPYRFLSQIPLSGMSFEYTSTKREGSKILLVSPFLVSASLSRNCFWKIKFLKLRERSKTLGPRPGPWSRVESLADPAPWCCRGGRAVEGIWTRQGKGANPATLDSYQIDADDCLSLLQAAGMCMDVGKGWKNRRPEPCPHGGSFKAREE